jgi:tetratricopeptide (TPR) repeat protein
MICAEAYSCTPHKEILNLTPRSPKSAVSGRELARFNDLREVLPSGMIRITAITLVLLAGCCAAMAQDLEPALERARELGQEHRYEEVIELLAHFEGMEDQEAQYVVSAEIGRAHFHLGNYGAANTAFRKAVALRPQRVETALYFQASSYLIGDRDQAYAIFREIVASGATDLYLAVTLPGERAFLSDPVVWSILEELATPVIVDLDRGSVLGVRLGQSRAEVETRFGADSATTGDTLTARAGPYLTWAFGFDEEGKLDQVMMHNEHLLRYTPYRLQLGSTIVARSTPEAATAALGAPASTSSGGDDLVVMVWLRGELQLTLEFAAPRESAPPGVPADRPMLRVVRMEKVEPEAEEAKP